jgi:hypothetical protein
MEGTLMVVRRWLVAAMLMCSASPLMADPRDIARESTRELTARVYDYARFDRHQLQRAQRQVTETYAAAGVRLVWYSAVVPERIEAGKDTWPTDGVTTITVVVLGEAMGAQRGVPDEVAGYAPITREGGGRIAYVVGDRIRRIADDGLVTPWEVMAGVITHEIAHLLMPERKHAADGVMRAIWNPVEFRQVPMQRFSQAEAMSLRRMVSSLGGGIARVAD